MKLTRIAKIREHRVFRDFAWPNNLHEFGQFNLIYGWNASGKTTLSSLLALVEKRTLLSEGEVELEFDGKTKIAGTAFGSAQLPEVRVFNHDFIIATLQSAGSIEPIFVIGEESIEKQTQVVALKEDLARADAEIATATSEKTVAETTLEDFCTDKAKVIKELLITANSNAYNNYDKRRFKQAVQGLAVRGMTAAILTDDQKTILRKQKDAQPKPDIETVAAPSLDLPALTKQVDGLLGRRVVAQTLGELTSSAEFASWVQQGLALHSGEHASETCRFCRQPLTAARRSALEAHFNATFEIFQRELTTLLSELQTAKQSAGSLHLPERSSFYDHLVAEATAAITAVTTGAKAVVSAMDTLIELVSSKRDNPFASAPTAPALATKSPLDTAIATLNTIVDRHNKTTREFPTSVDEACKKLESAYIADAHAEYVSLVSAVTDADTELTRVRGKPATIRREIETLESAILEHRRPAEELTAELRAYLGRDELRFEVKGAGYSLTRGDQPVSHLSEGERTAIAFLYFLKSLEDRRFDMAKGIVVIDDPVSSLDANALFSAFGHMKERTKQSGQLFIFTHSFSFFRLVKNWLQHLKRRWKKLGFESQPTRFFLLCNHRHLDGTRTGHLGPLDPLLEEHESEYQYLFKRIYEEAHRTDVGSMENHYGIPNVARRLLETFLSFRFPEIHGDDRLHRCFDRVTFDNSKKTRVLRLLNTYSHAGAIADPEHDLSLLSETQPVLLNVLEMMKAVDKDHYEGLEKLVAPVAAAGGGS